MIIELPKIGSDADQRGLTLVQDVKLTSIILPIFSFDPAKPADRVLGHGTLFRVDPWDGCATAFHVIEDVLMFNGEKVDLKQSPRLVALEVPGIGYGTLPISPKCWRPITEVFTRYRLDNKPFTPKEVRNFNELASIFCTRGEEVSPMAARYLPLALTNSTPQVGDKITAFGYADLDVDKDGEGDDRAVQQRLYRSDAIITDVEKPNPFSGRPWPIARVHANWPGGMSGGPVFNQDGVVVGLVSTGFPGANIGTAVLFSGWSEGRHTFGRLDPLNPGRIKAFLALDTQGKIVGTSLIELELVSLLETGIAARVVRATVDFSTGDFLH